jgi:hypothetical protein
MGKHMEFMAIMGKSWEHPMINGCCWEVIIYRDVLLAHLGADFIQFGVCPGGLLGIEKGILYDFSPNIFHQTFFTKHFSLGITQASTYSALIEFATPGHCSIVITIIVDYYYIYTIGLALWAKSRSYDYNLVF